MRASHKQRGFIAALLHRLSGIALADLPAAAFPGARHARSTAPAPSTPSWRSPASRWSQIAEFGIVVALAVHMTLGLRVLAIEFFDFREKTLAALSACVAAVLGVGLVFMFSLV